MFTNLSEYNKKCIYWLLSEKYNYTDLQINNLLNGGKHITGKNVKADIKRILQGEPVDYVIGFKRFINCKIDLSYKPLIPRVETEYIVASLLKSLPKNNDKIEVLDIFSGSGCAGLAILKNTKNTFVTLTDIDKNCINQIKTNLKLNKLNKNRFKVIKSDIFSNIKGKYNVIFANPPYVPNNYVKLSKELFFEPEVALNGGLDGLKTVKKFLSQVSSYLVSDGTLYMEFGDNQQQSIQNYLEQLNLVNYTFHKDQFGVYRFLKLQNS